MATISDKAICIGKRDYSESSQIVTLFGRDHGKISAIAKGSKREKSKFDGGIDLLTIGEVMFVPAKADASLATLTEFNLIEPFGKLRNNLLAIQCAQYMASLTTDFTEAMDPHQKLYDDFAKSLEMLAQGHQPLNVLVNFELTLLQEVGMMPSWHRCCLCDIQLNLTNIYFSSREGGLICRDCEPAIIEKRFVSSPVIQLLQNPTTIDAADKAVIFKLHEILCYHQRETMGKETAIMKFVNTLLKQLCIK
ncbi:MAG: DNA repair protein RecO [Phycisphaerae bacterium]|nr:DNA repair protein RecO [Phycisphaerae bacterium]